MQSLPPTKPTPRPRAEALVVSLTTDLPGKGGACYQMLTRYSAGLRDALQAYVMRCCTLAFLMGCVTQCSRDLPCPYCRESGSI